ncbi:RNA polymerase sigma factor [Arcobacter sp.]|uniref:RNA polymerase sigma factor n=1 Tax=Arcobacter sp. TaxID=1872629 RepID=UPI003D136FE8
MIDRELIEKYQPYLYNLALRLVYYREDALDLTNDVWIKIIENIHTFEKKSEFKTWAYRIMINLFLNQKRKYTQLHFEKFANTMNELENSNLSNEYDEPFKQLLIEEAKIGCMMGMLLCLNPEQRAILIIGDIFEINSDISSEIFTISKENFRKKLSRARSDLYNFMNNQCSLINKQNSCKCEQKTKALIEKGYINPKNMQFTETYVDTIKKRKKTKSNALDLTMEKLYKNLYQNHPFYEDDMKIFATNLLKNKEIKKIFEL